MKILYLDFSDVDSPYEFLKGNKAQQVEGGAEAASYTVGELIDLLKTYPADQEVYWGAGSDYLSSLAATQFLELEVVESAGAGEPEG